MALERGNEIVHGLDSPLTGVIAPYEARQLSAQIWVNTHVIQRSEIASLDRRALVGQEVTP